MGCLLLHLWVATASLSELYKILFCSLLNIGGTYKWMFSCSLILPHLTSLVCSYQHKFVRMHLTKIPGCIFTIRQPVVLHKLEWFQLVLVYQQIKTNSSERFDWFMLVLVYLKNADIHGHCIVKLFWFLCSQNSVAEN